MASPNIASPSSGPQYRPVRRIVKPQYVTKQFLIDNSPARSKITWDREQAMKRQSITVLTTAVADLKLFQWVLNTACIFFHRFFAKRSIVKNDRFLISMACLSLACKVEECPRNLVDIIRVFHMQKAKPQERGKWSDNTFVDEFAKKEAPKLWIAEQAVLNTLNFYLTMYEHPYHFVVEFCKTRFTHDSAFLQNAVNYCNDSLSTNLCLQYDPRTIGLSLCYITCKQRKVSPFPTDEGKSFAEVYKLDPAAVTDIENQLMDFLIKTNRVKAPPTAAPQSRAPAQPAVDAGTTAVQGAQPDDRANESMAVALHAAEQPELDVNNALGLAGNVSELAEEGQPVKQPPVPAKGDGTKAVTTPEVAGASPGAEAGADPAGLEDSAKEDGVVVRGANSNTPPDFDMDAQDSEAVSKQTIGRKRSLEQAMADEALAGASPKAVRI